MRPERLEEEYRALLGAYDAGRLSEDGFVAECEALMTQDADGAWWSVDTSGQLLCYDDARGDWVQRSAPAPWGGDAGGMATTEARSDTRTAKTETVPKPTPAVAPAPQAQPTGPASGVTGLAIVFGVSLVISVLGWDLLALVPNKINTVVPTGSCTSFSPASVGMYFCSAFVGLRVVFGSLVLAVVLIILRKPIAAIINKINLLVPEAYRAVLPAVVASVFFAIVWAGSHGNTGGLWGFLPHRAFPAIVGVLVHAATSYGPGFMARHAGFFDARDRLSKFTRWMIVLGTPTLVSFLITMQERVSNEAFKQQFVVIVGMVVGILIMTPRSGNLADLRKDLGRAAR